MVLNALGLDIWSLTVWENATCSPNLQTCKTLGRGRNGAGDNSSDIVFRGAVASPKVQVNFTGIPYVGYLSYVLPSCMTTSVTACSKALLSAFG